MELYVNSNWTQRCANAYIAEAIAWSENGNHVTLYATGVTADEADAKLIRALRELKLMAEEDGGENHYWVIRLSSSPEEPAHWLSASYPDEEGDGKFQALLVFTTQDLAHKHMNRARVDGEDGWIERVTPWEILDAFRPASLDMLCCIDPDEGDHGNSVTRGNTVTLAELLARTIRKPFLSN